MLNYEVSWAPAMNEANSKLLLDLFVTFCCSLHDCGTFPDAFSSSGKTIHSFQSLNLVRENEIKNGLGIRAVQFSHS